MQSVLAINKLEDLTMELTELSKLLKAQNESGKGFQIHINSGCVEENSKSISSVELGDLYFTDCKMVGNTKLLSFGNDRRKPIDYKKDGTPLYPMEINSRIYVDISKIESVENVKDYEDWFEMPSSRVVNLYMYPENNEVNGRRNVISVGFIR